MVLAIQDAAEAELPAVQGIFYGIMLLGLAWSAVTLGVRPRLGRSTRSGPPTRFRFEYAHVAMGLGLYLGAQIAGGLLIGVISEVFDYEWPAVSIFVATTLFNIAAVYGLFVYLRGLGGSSALLGLQDPEPKRSILRGLAIYVACLPGFWGAGLLWRVFLDGVGYDQGPQDVAEMMTTIEGLGRITALFCAGLAIPFLEEVIFRGLMQNWVVRKAGVMLGIGATTLLFALLHGITPFGYLVAVSLACSIALHWTGSLWAAVAVHAANNTVNTLMLFFFSELIM